MFLVIFLLGRSNKHANVKGSKFTRKIPSLLSIGNFFPISVETLRLVIYKCEAGYTWELDIGYFDVPSQLYI